MQGECVSERKLLEGSGTMERFPCLPHPSSAERTVKAAAGENEVIGGTAGTELEEGGGTTPTALGRADAERTHWQF